MYNALELNTCYSRFDISSHATVRNRRKDNERRVREAIFFFPLWNWKLAGESTKDLLNFYVLNLTVIEVLGIPFNVPILWEHFPNYWVQHICRTCSWDPTSLQTLFVQKGAKQLGNSGVECVLISSHLPPELSSWQVWLSPGVLRSKCGSVLITLYRIQCAVFKSLLYSTEEWAALQLINF